MAILDFDLQLDRPGFSLALRERVQLDRITALFGPSGCGKTTLLRSIAGLEPDVRGRVSFDGECWQEPGRFVPAHRRGAGMVFQDTRLFLHLDVAGNLRFAARRASRERSGPDLDSVAGALDLAPLMDRDVASLSGGERQRVALGRALLARPRLLLLDEPLAALDRQRRGELLPYIESLPDQFGLPMLYVTHAVDEVARLAERTVVMVDGRITAQDPTPAILERLDLTPLTGLPEAGVVLPTRVIAHDRELGLTELEVAGQRLSVPLLDRSAGTQLRLRVRARDVALALQPPEQTSIRNRLRAEVLRVETAPESAFAEVLLELGGSHLRARVTRASARELSLEPGLALYALVKSVAVDGEPLSRDI